MNLVEKYNVIANKPISRNNIRIGDDVQLSMINPAGERIHIGTVQPIAMSMDSERDSFRSEFRDLARREYSAEITGATVNQRAFEALFGRPGAEDLPRVTIEDLRRTRIDEE